jgi:glucosamine 6-phosphate synthetase-like amidotransferase/phosphosugar isomerase protein
MLDIYAGDMKTMCGIATILLHPQERSAAVWQAIKETFTSNLLFNEERGKAATGLAVVQADGQVMMQKMPVPATEFVTTPEYQALLDGLNPQTTLLLGHTRRPTKGDPTNADNNHPLQIGPVFGVHNGHIDNDDILFTRWGLPRQAQVDSEIIFRLLMPFSPVSLNGQYLAAVRLRLRHLRGQFTFLACDRRAPDKLLVVKHHNPLCHHFHPEWNALIFSSRYLFLRKTFGRVVTTETLPHDQLLLFETGLLPQWGHRPVEMLPLYPSQEETQAPEHIGD